MKRGISRREFLEMGLAGMAVLVFPIGCGPRGGDSVLGRNDSAADDAGRFFDEKQYATIRALTGRMIPTDQDPGAIEAGVVDYIDYFLGAFQVDPPRIYAAGPYSGRHGGEGNFDVYLPLTRVQEISWRTYIEGSQGLAEREFNGPVVGLQEIYTKGIAQLNELAQDQYAADFADLAAAEQDLLQRDADKDFIGVVQLHAIEGMYAAPEYGGNQGLVGWKYINYEGDRQPVGYNRAQMELEDPTGVLSTQQLDDLVDLLRLVFSPYEDQLL